MHRVTRRGVSGHSTKRREGALPDGVGGTITGGPTEAIDLMEILNRSRTARAGAVTGAAHLVVVDAQKWVGADRDISLSDGSRILFRSVDDAVASRE